VSDGAYNEGLRAFLADDFISALAFWTPIALEGHGQAAWRIGTMHETGQGVPQDGGIAAEWYERGATAGERQAMAALGALYLNGFGVPQDFARAYLWLSLAVARGDYGAMALRDRAAANLSRDQLAEVEHQVERRFSHLRQPT
jgi:TPR repeat protein